MSRGMTSTTTPWLGDIPTEWGVERCKYNFSYHKDVAKDRASDYERLALTMKGVIKRSKDDLDGLQPKDFEGYQIVNKGDLVFKLIDLAGVSTSRVGLSAYDGLVSPAYILMHADESKISKEYATYFFLSMWHRLIFNEIGNGGIRSSLNSGDLLEVPITKPPISEQHAIVRYLDAKCAAIDETIERHKKIIEKLEEYRKNRITYLVTRGLRSKSMKASGSDWYGDIPSDWEVKRFKYIAKVMSNLVDPEPYKDLPQVGPDIIEKDSGRLVGKRTVEESGIISGNHLFYEGQLLYSKVRPALNKVVTAPFTGLCSADMYPIEAEINSEYLKWLMLSKPFTEQTRIIASIRVKMPKINQDELGNVVCVVPPTEEQEKIAMAIQEMCNKVQTSIDKHNDIINKLDEYRKSIIYNAVAGKIDCRTETQP